MSDRFDGSTAWERGEPVIGVPRHTMATHASYANDTPWGPEVDAGQDGDADAEVEHAIAERLYALADEVANMQAPAKHYRMLVEDHIRRAALTADKAGV